MKDSFGRPVRHVAETLVTATHLVRHEDINGANRLFGGRLLEWIDEAAGIAAMRQALAPITTVAIDTLEFRQPAFLNDVVTVEATVTHVERSSMEVRVDCFIDDQQAGGRHMINHAYLTEVCVDDEGRPAMVPYGLVADTEQEHAECAAARRRAELRKLRRAEGV